MNFERYYIEQKWKGTNRWFEVSQASFPTESEAWSWMETNESYFPGNDLRVVREVVSKTALKR